MRLQKYIGSVGERERESGRDKCEVLRLKRKN